MKARAFAEARLDPDAPAVALDHLLADREADARSGILALVVQTLEHHEDALEILRLDADAVVSHLKGPFERGLGDPHMYPWNRSRAELEGVADEVLKELPEL